MFNQGLSLDQAPPISVPFRFFITAPIFGILLGFAIFFFPPQSIVDRFSYISVGMVHLFTLGILAQIIFGAMQQMMPVLAGAIFKKAKLFASVIHISLIIGTLGLSLGFMNDFKELLILGLAGLTISFFTFFIYSTYLLFRVKYLTTTVKAMRLFSIFGLATSIIGIYLVSANIFGVIGELHYNFVSIHIALGIFGFASLLILGVSFQVIPMFYVAKSFPKYIQNKFPIFLALLILIFSVFEIFSLDTYIIKVVFAIIFTIFAYYGIDSLNNRRRPVFDATLWYWKLSFYSFIIAMLNWIFVPQDSSYLLAIIFGFGFLFSLLQGMVYKIIPFLCWFHLSSKGYFVIPTMKEMISEEMIKLNFFMHLCSLLFFIVAGFMNYFFLIIGASFFIVTNLIFLINIISGIKKFANIIKTDPMAAFSSNN